MFQNKQTKKHKQSPLPSASQCFLPAVLAPLSSPHTAVGEKLRQLGQPCTIREDGLWGSVPGARPPTQTGHIRHGPPGMLQPPQPSSSGKVAPQGAQAEERLGGKVGAVREKGEVRTWLMDSVPRALPGRPGVTLTRQAACCLPGAQRPRLD